MRKGQANVTNLKGAFREYEEETNNGFLGNMQLQCAMCLQCRVLVNNALHESRAFLIPFCQTTQDLWTSWESGLFVSERTLLYAAKYPQHTII